MLVELSVMEQRYQAVLAIVQDGWKVTEVAARIGVSRQSVHAWIARYERGWLAALTERSHRPSSCPHQLPPRSRPRSASFAVSTPAGDRGGSVTSCRSVAPIPSPGARASTGAYAATAW
jgi:hypothetical protein